MFDMKYSRFFLFLFFAGALALSSCAVDDIEIPGGSTDNRLKFLGTWSVSDNALKLNYEVTIDRNSSNSSEVLLHNFAGSGSTAEGLVVGSSIIVEDQVVGQNWLVSGSGSWKNEDRLEFNYAIEIGGSNENRRAIFTR